MKYIFTLIFLCLPVHAWFEHGRAVEAANNGDWHHAHSLLTTKLVDYSHDPLVVYDAGVAAYKIGDHEQARAYFEHVTHVSHASDQLKERAYFNLGNTQVTLKKLEDAIKSYEHALRIDPQDERARHNLEIVKKMLEEQKKQEQEKENDKEQQDKENKEEKEKQDQKGGQKEEQDESSTESGGESECDEHEGEGEQSSSAKATADKQDTKQSDASNKKEKERKQKNQEAKKQQADRQNEKEKQQHAAAGQEKQTEEKKIGATQAQSAVKLDKQLLRLLEQQEKHDAQVNKQMIKATLGGQGDKHDKNCW